MAADKLTIEEALQRGMAMPYAYIRSLSSVTFGETAEAPDPEELIEARFFDGSTEIRLFRRNGNLEAAVVSRADAAECIQRTYKIANPKLGSRYELAELITFDRDGQANIRDTMLTRWEA